MHKQCVEPSVFWPSALVFDNLDDPLLPETGDPRPAKLYHAANFEDKAISVERRATFLHWPSMIQDETDDNTYQLRHKCTATQWCASAGLWFPQVSGILKLKAEMTVASMARAHNLLLAVGRWKCVDRMLNPGGAYGITVIADGKRHIQMKQRKSSGAAGEGTNREKRGWTV